MLSEFRNRFSSWSIYYFRFSCTTSRYCVNTKIFVFLIHDILDNNPIFSSFSMGQKSRLTLGAAMWVKPHCLLLDEPTNYIDQETLDALARALKFFRGPVLVVSHKESFVQSVCNERWQLEGKKLTVGKV